MTNLLGSMQFSNGSGKRINMMYPVDNAFWTKLKAFVDYEPVSAIDPELRGVLASIGIVKGQPFNPTAKQQELLQKAVETAPKMILVLRQLGRPDGRNLYYKDRQWENVWAGTTADWFQDSYLDVNQRVTYFQVAYSSAPAMVMWTAGGRVQISRCAPGCEGRVPTRLEHLQATPAAQSAGRAVLGRHCLQHQRRDNGGSTATDAVDQRVQQSRDQRRRLG
jgi:hypothetical protein